MSISQSDVDALLAAAEELAVESSGDAAPAAEASFQAPPDPSPPAAPPPAAGSAPDSREVSRLLHLRVPVIVRLAEQDMPVERVLAITAGAIIEFDRAFDAELDLIVANQQIGTGQAVKVGENFGLRISHVGAVDDRIKALGGK